MLIFWVFALLMIIIALALLLPAFWGRYQSSSTTFSEQNIQIARDRLTELKQQLTAQVITEKEYNQQRSELEQTLAIDLENISQPDSSVPGDKRIVHILILALLVPVMAFSLYFSIGTPGILFKKNNSLAQQHINSSQPPQHSMEELITRLENRLQKNSDDAEGWMMLARTYMSQNRYKDAASAFAKVNSIIGGKASILFAQADALAMAQGGRMSGKPAELVKKGLKLQAENVTGLWLAGLAEEEQGNYKQAIEYWQTAEKLLVNDTASANKIRSMINRVKGKLTENDNATTRQQTSMVSIKVRVDIADHLLSQVKHEDTVFIYAQAAKGSRMPLAIVKKKASELPTQVLLSDQMAMVPNMSLSNFPEVNIYARISRSGQTTAQPGDFMGVANNIYTHSSSELNIIIDQVIP